MILASAGGTLFGLVVGIYIIGAVAALAIFRLNSFRSSTFGIRTLLRPGRRQGRAEIAFALAWPVHLYRYASSRGDGAGSTTAQPLLPNPPSAGPAPPPTVAPDPAASGLEIKRYGLIEEDDD